MRTALIHSTPFKALARANARALGAPDLYRIEIPHPLGGISKAEVAARVEVALPQFVAFLKGAASS
ncbi:MAG: hypothetical protein AB7G13_06835 [Lautropia sp.]